MNNPAFPAFFRLIAAVLISPLIISGCGSYKYTRKKDYDVGRVNVRVVSVMPFDAVRTELQPAFEMTEEKALKDALATTMIGRQDVDDVMKVVLKAAMTGWTKTGTKTQTSNDSATASAPQQAAGQQPPTETQSEEKPPASLTVNVSKTGEVSYSKTITSTLSAPDLTNATAMVTALDKTIEDYIKNSPTKTPQNVESSKAILSPYFTYPAANALFQEVKLINRTVDFALRNEDNYYAYVVRAQITLDTRANDAPYDVYSYMSFFMDNKTPAKDCGLVEDESGSKTYLQPVVLPLFATESMEMMNVESRNNKVRNYVLALSALAYNVSGELGVDKYLRKYQQYVGNEYNNLFTIGSPSENTLSAHFGAVRKVDLKGGGAVDQQLSSVRNVSFLLLVPKSVKEKDNKVEISDITEPLKSVRMVTNTRFIHGDSGVQLVGADYDDMLNATLHYLKRFHVRIGVGERNKLASILPVLMKSIEDNNRKCFDDTVDGLSGMFESSAYGKDSIAWQGVKDRLWVGLVEIKSWHQYAVSRFTLPRMYVDGVSLPKDEIIMPIYDDGKSSWVELTFGRTYHSEPWRWALMVNKKMFMPKYFRASKSGSTEIVFPSLKAFGVSNTKVFKLIYRGNCPGGGVEIDGRMLAKCPGYTVKLVDVSPKTAETPKADAAKK